MSEKTLTRMDLSEAVFREVGLSRNESANLVESVLQHMSDALASGETVATALFSLVRRVTAVDAEAALPLSIVETADKLVCLIVDVNGAESSKRIAAALESVEAKRLAASPTAQAANVWAKLSMVASLYDAMPKRTAEHDPVNMWTEDGMFDVITSMPNMSRQIRSDIMDALYGSEAPYSQTAREEKPHPIYKGAMAYRTQKWKQYKPLSDVFEGLQGSSSEPLKESVYMGGYELFPLVMNQSGFGSPVISSSAIFARRAAYLAGDDSKLVQQAYKGASKMRRIVTYTIDEGNKSSEIDKLSLTAMKNPHDGTSYGGIPPKISECFRSQNIPNLVNADKKLESWVDKNLSRKLPGYYSDIDFISQQGGDITFTYWNRRIGCFCDRCGRPFGSTPINNGGDGDKLYDKKRMPFCRYPLAPTMTAWNAWAGKDNFQKCLANGQNEGFYDGTGLKDEK